MSFDGKITSEHIEAVEQLYRTLSETPALSAPDVRKRAARLPLRQE